MRPIEVLAQQQALYDNLSRPSYEDYLTRFAADVAKKGSGPTLLNAKGEQSGVTMASQQRYVLKMAETFMVTADMVQMVTHAALGLDDLDQFTHDLWPSEHGFCWFEGGVDTVDVWGRHMPLHALVWERRSYQGTSGMFVCCYVNSGEGHDEKWQGLSEEERLAILARMGRLHMSHTAFFADGKRVGPLKSRRPDYYAQFAEEGDTLSSEGTNQDRIILALLMLLGQTITSTTRHDLRPANPKRARKMKIPGQITVITLRHAKHAARQDGESLVEWSHRWVVRGHWRSQSCGPHYPGAQEIAPDTYRARLWIAPFVKGPEDRPLVVRPKVNRLSR